MNLNFLLRPARRTLFLTSFCTLAAVAAHAISITGTVHDDGDGGTISGPGMYMADNTQLYVYLIDNSNTIMERATVDANGNYTLLTAIAYVNYNVAVSSSFYFAAATNPNLGLSNNYTPTAEGTSALGDGTPDYAVAINSGTDLVINYGIDRRPNGNNYTLSVPTYDQDRRVIIPDAAFTGTDFEDGTYTAGLFGRSIDLYQATGGTLYYNGAPITFSSASAATRFQNFDASKLRFRSQGTGTHQFAFSILDDAGKVELAPNTIRGAFQNVARRRL